MEAALRELQGRPFGRNLILEAELLAQRSHLRDEEKIKGEIAKALCNICPMKQECLKYAIYAGETFGIWGGATPRERNMIKAQWETDGRANA